MEVKWDEMADNCCSKTSKTFPSTTKCFAEVLIFGFDTTHNVEIAQNNWHKIFVTAI